MTAKLEVLEQQGFVRQLADVETKLKSFDIAIDRLKGFLANAAISRRERFNSRREGDD